MSLESIKHLPLQMIPGVLVGALLLRDDVCQGEGSLTVCFYLVVHAGIEMAPSVARVLVILGYRLAVLHSLWDCARERLHIWAGFGRRQLRNKDRRRYLFVFLLH